MKFNIFTKKQKETLKAINLEKEIVETTTLKLKKIELQFYRSHYDGDTFRADILHVERPTDKEDEGMKKQTDLRASSWAELIEKVSEYFEENDG